MTTNRPALLLFVLALTTSLAGAGCASRTVYVRDDIRSAPPPPPPPQVVVVERPAPLEVVRADDIEAGYVAARVIHADVVVARAGHVGRIIEVSHPGHGRGQGRGGGRNRGDISTAEIVADEIHVNELYADRLEADVIYAERVIIGEAPAVQVRHRPERPRRETPRPERPRQEQGSTVVVVEHGRDRAPGHADAGRGRGRSGEARGHDRDERDERDEREHGRGHHAKPEKPEKPEKPTKPTKPAKPAPGAHQSRTVDGERDHERDDDARGEGRGRGDGRAEPEKPAKEGRAGKGRAR